MRVIIVTAGCLAIGVAIAAPTASAQQPIREGLRRTGEIAAEGTRRVVGGAVEGAGAVARGAGEVAAGTVDAGRAVIGGTARAAAAGVDAITPDLPLQARVGARLGAGEELRDARWRFAQHNGEWWYYAPENNWMYHRDGQWNEFAEDSFVPNAGAGQFGGEYASGYRGVDQGGAVGAPQGDAQYGEGGYAQGPVYTLQYDEQGREYICDNGQRVYFDSQPGAEGQWGDPAPGVPTEAGYRGPMDQPAAGATPEPATGTPTLPADAAPAAGATPPADAAPAAGATPPADATQPGGTAPPAGAGVSGAIEGGLPAEPAQ